MVLPLLSMDKPDAAHLVLYKWQKPVDKVSLVTGDLKYTSEWWVHLFSLQFSTMFTYLAACAAF